MSKIKPFWRIVIGFLILVFCVYNTSSLALGGNFFAFAFWWAVLAAYIYLAVRVKYDDPLRSLRDIVAEQAAKGSEPEPPVISEAELKRQAEEARRAEWERMHGRIVTPVAGVTFKNDDGTSRQELLKDLKASGGERDVTLEEFEYKSAPAIRVLVDDECIGNIPKGRVQEIQAIMEHISAISLKIETFYPEDETDFDGKVTRRGKAIYRADLELIYLKEDSDEWRDTSPRS